MINACNFALHKVVVRVHYIDLAEVETTEHAEFASV